MRLRSGLLLLLATLLGAIFGSRRRQAAAPRSDLDIAYDDIEVGKVVLIGWEDSVGCLAGWRPRDEARSTEYALGCSVGWVVAKDEKAIQIAAHVGFGKRQPNTQIANLIMGDMVIPRSAIIEIEILLAPNERDTNGG